MSNGMLMGFPSNNAFSVHFRGGVRNIYLLNSFNNAYYEQAQKSVLQEDTLYLINSGCKILYKHWWFVKNKLLEITTK